MRKVREITAEEENFRTEPWIGESIRIVKKDPIEPEPVGTIVLFPFRIVGYDQDCDGSLMARLEAVDLDGETTGWTVNHIGLYPNSSFVVSLEELNAFFVE